MLDGYGAVYVFICLNTLRWTVHTRNVTLKKRCFYHWMVGV